MLKVIIIGCPGAGKSTFARKLRDLTGLPLIYLDRLWHRSDGTHITKEEFDGQLAEILQQQDKWILDGNYNRTLEMRLRACDTVFLLDYPLQVCLAGAQERVGKPHEDLPWLEETFDPDFRQWIVNFGEDHLPQIYELLEKYREGREIFVFKSREEADTYLSRSQEGFR